MPTFTADSSSCSRDHSRFFYINSPETSSFNLRPRFLHINTRFSYTSACLCSPTQKWLPIAPYLHKFRFKRSSHSESALSPSPTVHHDSCGDKFCSENMAEQFIEERRLNDTLFRHKKTDAEDMSLINSNENKVFDITFTTPPKNSTEIPRILERSLLFGSRKHPLKESFIVVLLKDSLNTILNMSKYPDRTYYPVASINTKPQFPWNLIEKAKATFKKEPTMEDELRKRIERTKSDSGGGGDGPRNPTPWDRGDDDDGEPEDEDGDCSWDERLQVFLATTGLVFVYMYIIKGQEMSMTARDCIVRYLLKGPRTGRVASVEFVWEVIVRNIRGDTEVEKKDPIALLRAIVNTPTWWDSPEKYKGYLDDDHPPLKFSDFYSDSDHDFDDPPWPSSFPP